MPLISGRSEQQINRAKFEQYARLGTWGASKGRRKKCKKGKSCGAACILRNKVCMVDIPWAINPQISYIARWLKNLEEREGKGGQSPEAPKPPKAPKAPSPAIKPKPPKKPFKPRIPEHEVPEAISSVINIIVNGILNMINSK